MVGCLCKHAGKCTEVACSSVCFGIWLQPDLCQGSFIYAEMLWFSSALLIKGGNLSALLSVAPGELKNVRIVLFEKVTVWDNPVLSWVWGSCPSHSRLCPRALVPVQLCLCISEHSSTGLSSVCHVRNAALHRLLSCRRGRMLECQALNREV